jgi:chromosome segregation ATPase
LRDKNDALQEYVQRANFELQSYHDEYGALQHMRDSRHRYDNVDDKDPTLLNPLFVAYDRRIRCLEEELERLKKVEQEVNAQNMNMQAKEQREASLTKECEALQQQLDKEIEKGASLHGTLSDMACVAETDRGRLQVAQDENKVLRDSQSELTKALAQMSDKVKQYETENRNLEGSKTLLQSTVQALQQKEAALQHRLAEAGDLNEKLRVLQHQLQGSQQQENSIAASYKEALEAIDNAQRENRHLQKEIEDHKQTILALQQSEFENWKRLKETYEQTEECKVDLSSGLVREGQKDIQLANLREQMRQLLAIQTETHNKHLKVVSGKHRTHVDELREEIKAKDIELSNLKAQLEKCLWEKRQKDRELEAIKREAMGFAPALDSSSSMAHGTFSEDLHAKLQQVALQRDELQHRLEQESQRHRREERERELQSEHLRNQSLEKDRRAVQLEGICNDLRDEVTNCQKDIDRLQKQVQAVRLQKDEAERKLEYDMAAATSHAHLQEERLRIQMEEALSKQRQAEVALDKALQQKTESQRQVKQDLQYEREKFDQQLSDSRAEVIALDKHVRELSTQLALSQQSAKEREREAEAVTLRSQQISKSLDVHKEQLGRTTQKLSVIIEREATTRRDLKDCQLQLDRERLERDRVEKDRDRYRTEVQQTRALLQGPTRFAADEILEGTAGPGDAGLLEDMLAIAGDAGRKKRRPRTRSSRVLSGSSATDF